MSSPAASRSRRRSSSRWRMGGTGWASCCSCTTWQRPRTTSGCGPRARSTSATRGDDDDALTGASCMRRTTNGTHAPSAGWLCMLACCARCQTWAAPDSASPRVLHAVLLDHGFILALSYGALVLAVEIISSTATLGYAVLLTRQSRLKPSLGLPLAEPGAPLPADPRLLRFNLRVLIPCYKEPVGILRETVLGALHAGLPANTRRTIYLCDDLPGVRVGGRWHGGHSCCPDLQQLQPGGKPSSGIRSPSVPPPHLTHPHQNPDPEKEALMTELDHEFGGCVYVTRKLRKHEREAQAAAAAAATAAAQHEEQAAAAKGGCLPWWADQQSKAKAAGGAEVNGKSNNLNNCLRNVIYKDFDAAYAASKRSTGSSATAGTVALRDTHVLASMRRRSPPLDACMHTRQLRAHAQSAHPSTTPPPCAGGIPSNEVMVVLDADMVAEQDFFVRCDVWSCVWV